MNKIKLIAVTCITICTMFSGVSCSKKNNNESRTETVASNSKSVRSKREVIREKRGSSGVADPHQYKFKKMPEQPVNIDKPEQEEIESVNISNYVNAYKSQIKHEYRKALEEMYGIIEITLYINENDNVDGVDIVSGKGSYFSDRFLNKIEEIIIANWRIPVKEKTKYQFKMKFIRNS